MIVLITGTPGVGKSTISNLLSKKSGFNRISINEVAIGDVCDGVERGSKVVNIEKLSQKIKKMIVGDTIVDGHLSHFLPFGDLVIVLRTNPKVLEKRLLKKGFGKEKIRENLEAEALDSCLIESLKNHDRVFEVDTSNKTPEDIAEDILKIIKGNAEEFMPGKIDWSEEFFDVNKIKK